MNPFDALIAKKTPQERAEWLEPVKRNGTGHIPAEPKPSRPAREVALLDAVRDIPLPFGFQRSGIAGAVVIGDGNAPSIRPVMFTDFYRGNTR